MKADDDQTGPGAGRAGRARTTQAVLAAAQTLFAERGFTAVTVRDIAAEAGVSHALVHRYLGNKEAIYRAVLATNEDAIRGASGDEEELLTAASLMLREGIAHQRSYLRLIRALRAARSFVRPDDGQIRRDRAARRARCGGRGGRRRCAGGGRRRPAFRRRQRGRALPGLDGDGGVGHAGDRTAGHDR